MKKRDIHLLSSLSRHISYMPLWTLVTAFRYVHVRGLRRRLGAAPPFHILPDLSDHFDHGDGAILIATIDGGFQRIALLLKLLDLSILLFDLLDNRIFFLLDATQLRSHAALVTPNAAVEQSRRIVEVST